VGIFVALIGYVVYFNTIRSEDFINSPYNTRQNTFADRVIRGSIISSDGQTLAYTQADEDGNETRIYPYENVFAHVVGYTDQGKSGLESLANFELLTSHASYFEQLENELLEQKNVGDNVITTLDANLQMTAYEALGSYDGAVVIMNARTGAILAMVSKPNFNPNTLSENWDSLVSDESDSSLLNRATQGAYPPGSTFKIITALAYLREHGNLDGFYFNCTGSITEKEHTIHCYNDSVHGEENLTKAFAKSCNSAFAKMGLDLGADVLNDAASDMLFNKKLPLNLVYRKSSFALTDEEGSALMMQTAIGQGNTLVSPMHMALIVSAIANDGELMRPYLIERVENYKGTKIRSTHTSAYKQLLSPSEAEALQGLMESVVREGTGSKLSGESYTAAGKTGSAEYDSAEGRKTHSWFVGYSNVEDPELVVSVIAEGAGTGSEVAVPIAKKIFNAYYYD
jgi:peptidoglycan glycosyltransferase